MDSPIAWTGWTTLQGLQISMVNEKRIKKKLPELLVDGPLTQRKNFNKYQLNRYKLGRIEKKNATFFNRHFRKVVKALEEFEEAMNNTKFEF